MGAVAMDYGGYYSRENAILKELYARRRQFFLNNSNNIEIRLGFFQSNT